MHEEVNASSRFTRIVKRQECLFCFLCGMSFNYVSAGFLADRCTRITWPFCCHSSQRIVVSQSLSFPPAAIVAALPPLRRLQKPIWKINKGLTPVHLVAFRQMFHRSQGAVCTNRINLSFSPAVPRAFGGKNIIDFLYSQTELLTFQ